MASDGEPTDTALSEAIAESQATIAHAFAGDLETRYMTLKKEKNSLYDSNKKQESQIAELQAQAKSLQNALLERDAELSAVKREKNTLQEQSANREAAEKSQQERMSRMEAEADNLREEISRLTDTNKTLSAQVVEMETKSKLTESSAIPLSYEVERTRKELDSLSAHSQWLNKELQERSDQLVAEKQKHSDQILEITQKLDAAVAERDEYRSTVAALKKSQSDLRTRTEELALKLREAEQETINIKESSTQELQAKDRLVAAQQEQLDNRAREYNRLVHEKESLTELANQASQTTKREVDNVRLSLQEETQKIIEEQNERHLREVALLQSRLEDAVRRADQAEDRVMTSTRPRLAAPDRPLTLTQGDDEEPLGMTDLYDRLYQAQNALQKEQAEVRKLKLILQKIQAEIDAKTPQIRREREEGDFAKQQLQESRARLNAAFEELEAVRQELKETTLDKEELTKHNRELKQENTELAKQVQALLVSRAGGELDSEIPITVQQIQTQNQQLLQEHRRLSRTVEELEEKLQNDPLQIKHEQLEEELRTLREEQEKQEAAVSGIVEQRDLYRAIAFSQNSSLEVGNIDSVSSLAERNRQLAQRCTELETSLTKARSDLDSMVRDKETLEHRVARYETLTTELTSSNDRLQREISSAVASIARTESDAAYHRDRVGRLEELVDQARSEAQRAQESANQMQTVNANLQKAVSAAKAEASKREQESLQAGMKLRLAETQVETAKASELYLSNQVTQLRTEIARQGALLESVQRIENSISAKNEETKERLFEDYQRLQDELSTERSKHNLETENLSGRIRELEIDLKAANEKKDEALASELETKKQALVTSEKVHELKTKCSTLEAELRAAKKKLGVEDIDGEDMEVVLQAKVISLTADLEKAQEELKLAKESATKYQNFATTKEEENAELAKAFDLFKKQQQEEIEALRIKLEQTKKEAEPQQQLIIELTNDLANQRGEREKVVAELKAKVASLEAESESLRKDAEIAESRVASMSAEVAAYQADATTAQNNYESELMKHAAACSKLRAVQEDAEKDVLRRREAEERLEMVHMQIDEERKLMEEKKKALDKTVKDLEKSLEDARAQNDILHRQLASQGDELEKLQSERIDAATSNDAPGGETDSGAGAASLQKEVDLLRSQRSELREMLRYARSEHEATRAQVDAARHTAEREKATAAVTKHALDEARAELKVAQSSLASASESDGSRVKDLTDKLNAANEQVTLLSESNKLLREETDKMRATTSSLQDELATLKSNIVPKENKTRELESEKAALEAEKASLIRQLEDWEQRMRTVISSTNQIDPTEHEKALKQVEELRNECATVKSEKRAAEKATESAKTLVLQLNKQLSQQKEIVSKQKQALAKATSDKDVSSESSKAIAEVTQERNQLREQVKKLTTNEKSAKTELGGANTRIEKLKNHLRTYQKKMNELQQKLQQAESDLSTSKAELKAAQMSASSVAPSKSVEKSETTTPAVARTISSKEAPEDVVTEPLSKNEDSKVDAPSLSVPASGFRYGPGGLMQPSPSKVPRKRRAIASPPRADSETKEANTAPKPATKKPKPAPLASKLVESKSSESKQPLPTKSMTPSASLETEAKAEVPDNDGATKQGENDLRAKLLKRKRELADRMKKIAEEEQNQKRAKTEVGEDRKLSDEKIEKETEETPVAKVTNAAALVSAPVPVPAPAQAEATKDELPKSEENLPSDEPAEEEPEPDEKRVDEAVQDTSTTAPVDAAQPEAKEETKSSEESNEAKSASAGDVSKKSSLFGKPSTFGSGTPFGGGTPFGIAPTFGSGKAGASLTFGSSSTVPKMGSEKGESSSAQASVTDKPSSFGGGAFLNLKPPGSTGAAPKFSFGSSTSITLPTPAKGTPSSSARFGAFGQGSASPFGSGLSHASAQAQPLFGTSSTVTKPPEQDVGDADDDEVEDTTDQPLAEDDEDQDEDEDEEAADDEEEVTDGDEEVEE